MHFIILKSRKLHFSLHGVIPPSSQTTSPTCPNDNFHYVLQHICNPSQFHIICKFSNYNPGESMKSTNGSAEYYWSRTNPADCNSESESMGTASRLLLHSSYWTLSSFPDINTTTRIFYFISPNRSITDTQSAPKIICRYY